MAYNLEIEKIAASRLSQVDFDNLVFGKTFADHMYIADYEDGKWQDGKIIPYQELNFWPSLVALHYGATVFEGLKAYRHENGDVFTFRPDKHASRMFTSAERLCMPGYPEDAFVEGLKALLDLDREWIPKKKGSSLYIRPIMFATDQYLGVAPATSFKFVIFSSPVSSYYAGSVKVKVETEFTRAAEGGTGNIKMGGNYAASLLPTKKALEEGYQQVLWTDGKEHKYVEECGTMNVFFQIGDTIITPSTSTSILSGVTRMSIIELAKKWGYKIEERKISLDEITAAHKAGELKDAFGTGTAATITPISVIGYDGVDYELPTESSREFSNKVNNYMTGLKQGEAEDLMNWMVKI